MPVLRSGLCLAPAHCVSRAEARLAERSSGRARHHSGDGGVAILDCQLHDVVVVFPDWKRLARGHELPRRNPKARTRAYSDRGDDIRFGRNPVLGSRLRFCKRHDGKGHINPDGSHQVWKLALSVAGSPLVGTGFESFWLGPRLKRCGEDSPGGRKKLITAISRIPEPGMDWSGSACRHYYHWLSKGHRSLRPPFAALQPVAGFFCSRHRL